MTLVERWPTSREMTSISWDGPVATVVVSGELDFISAPALAEGLQGIEVNQGERLVLDLAGLVFVDVAGARMLDRSIQAISDGGPVTIRGLQPSALRVFRLTGFMKSSGAAPDGTLTSPSARGHQHASRAIVTVLCNRSGTGRAPTVALPQLGATLAAL